MGQTQSQEENNESSEPLQSGTTTAMNGHNNDIRIKEGKEKKSKRGKDASESRKRKPPTNDRNGSRAIWSPSSPEPEAEQHPRPSKRKRVSDLDHKSKDINMAEEGHTETNNIPSAAPDTRGPEDSKRPKYSPEQPKVPTEQRKPNNAAKPASASRKKPEKPKSEAARGSKRNSVQGHQSETNEKITGFFTAAEVETLENFKLDFCNDHGLSGDTFDLMVQHSDRSKRSDFPCSSDIISKYDFWRAIYAILPGRARRSTYRFMRRHFQASTQKPHLWTEEQDEELVSLYMKHGPKFAYIAKLIGRCDDDVVQRWKNRLEHRDKMRRGPWSSDESSGLLGAVQAAYDSLIKAGTKVGKDVYEMDETLIGWGVVSDRMQNRRSRQQCADKWRRVRRSVLNKRANGNPDAVYDVGHDTKPPRRKSKSAASSPANPQFKSSTFVNSDSEGEDEAESKAQPANSQNSTPKGRKSFETPMESPEPATSSQETSTKPTSADDSESESESESGLDSQPANTKPRNSESQWKTQNQQTKKDVKNSRPVNGEKPKATADKVQKKSSPISNEKAKPSELASGNRPKDDAESKAQTNGLVSSATKAPKEDTSAQGRKRSPTPSSSSESESSDASDSDSPAPQPGTDATKPKAEVKEEHTESTAKKNEEADDSSGSEESSSEESESDDEEEDASSDEEEQQRLKPSSPKTPAPQSTPTPTPSANANAKRKPEPASTPRDSQPSLKRLKAEIAQSENNKPAAAEPIALKKVLSESESESESESDSSKESSESESESESEESSESDSGSESESTPKPESESKKHASMPAGALASSLPKDIKRERPESQSGIAASVKLEEGAAGGGSDKMDDSQSESESESNSDDGDDGDVVVKKYEESE
ncbi:Dna-binding protein [Aspergillus sp. HF37]|nr:Dna-binding protein [Aspergillus sp. HF37]